MTLSALNSKMKIVIYTKKACPHCLAAKVWLSQRDYTIEEISLDDAEDLNHFHSRYPELRTMPQIFVGGESIGGFSDLLRSAL